MYTFKFLQNEANAADRFETITRADNDRKIPVQKVSKLIRISKTIQRAIEHDANIMWFVHPQTEPMQNSKMQTPFLFRK